jgi:hypothetical protein
VWFVRPLAWVVLVLELGIVGMALLGALKALAAAGLLALACLAMATLRRGFSVAATDDAVVHVRGGHRHVAQRRSPEGERRRAAPTGWVKIPTSCAITGDAR